MGLLPTQNGAVTHLINSYLLEPSSSPTSSTTGFYGAGFYGAGFRGAAFRDTAFHYAFKRLFLPVLASSSYCPYIGSFTRLRLSKESE